jgi:hypothetical protein
VSRRTDAQFGASRPIAGVGIDALATETLRRADPEHPVPRPRIDELQIPGRRSLHDDVVRRDVRVVQDHVVVVSPADLHGQPRRGVTRHHLAVSPQHLDVDQFVHEIAST